MSTYGYIRIPRTLRTDSLWLELDSRERHAFDELLYRMAFKETVQDDHGILITVKPFQLLMTQRKFVEWCNSTKPKEMEKFNQSFVKRFLEKIKMYGFSTQEVNHTKTLLTIVKKDICEVGDSENDSTLTQERLKIDSEKKKEKKDEKEKEKKLNKENPSKKSIREWVCLTEDEIDKFFHMHGDSLGNLMLDILDSYNTSRMERYKSDYGALKTNGWVHKEAIKRNTPLKPQNVAVDRRTKNIDGTPVESVHDGRF